MPSARVARAAGRQREYLHRRTVSGQKWSLARAVSPEKLFGCKVYHTEQRDNHGTMILHGVCYSAYTLR